MIERKKWVQVEHLPDQDHQAEQTQECGEHCHLDEHPQKLLQMQHRGQHPPRQEEHAQ